MFEQFFQPTQDQLIWGHIPSFVTPYWFHQARSPIIEATESICGDDELFGAVRRTTFDYGAEIYGNEQVLVRTGFSYIGNSSCICYQQAWQSGRLAVVGETLIVTIDPLKKMKRAMSPELVGFLNQHLWNGDESVKEKTEKML